MAAWCFGGRLCCEGRLTRKMLFLAVMVVGIISSRGNDGSLVMASPTAATATSRTTTTKSGGAHEQQQRSLMVDGTDTRKGRYPYHTEIGGCSGALIAPDIVLTAGHDMPPPDAAVGMKVPIGAYYTNTLDNGGKDDTVQVRTVTQAFLHPNYTVIHNDFAILILDKPVDEGHDAKSNNIIRINRNQNIPRPYEMVTILGTGTSSLTSTERPDVLQEGNTKYLPTEECREQGNDSTRGVSYSGEFLDDTNLCTFGGSDGCVFDSGGPIILKKNGGDHPDGKKSNDKDDLLIALVSYGVDCGDPVYPAVNARISAAADWIDAMVCQYSVNPPKGFSLRSFWWKQPQPQAT